MTFLDRIKETSTSTGTGTFTLGGAVLGYKVFTNGTYKYCIVNETESEWEVGEGTVASGVLTRTTIEASSNGGAAVSFSAGTKYVFNTVSAAYVNSLVPYTGATAAVNLGAYGLTSDYLQLSTTPTASGAVGRTIWNDSIGSTQTTLKGGSVVLKNGVDLVARVVNKVTPATTLTKATYKAVRVSGAQGQRLAIAYAQANTDNNSADTIGLVCETIAANQEGFIITVGQLTGINTTGSLQGETWADGDVLYLSPTTAGNLTNIKPTGATGHIVVIGYVEYAHAINGSIYVKIMNGWELDELHNVYINAVANNDVLVYESSSSLWKNKSIATILGYTPQAAITLTTTGSSGASTFVSNTLNIPTYTLAGLGGQAQLNGTGFVKATGTTISYDNTTYATDSLVVHLAGAENITGVKTFQNALQTTTGNNLLNTGGGNTVIGYTADPASSATYKLDVNGGVKMYGVHLIQSNVAGGNTFLTISNQAGTAIATLTNSGLLTWSGTTSFTNTIGFNGKIGGSATGGVAIVPGGVPSSLSTSQIMLLVSAPLGDYTSTYGLNDQGVFLGGTYNGGQGPTRLVLGPSLYYNTGAVATGVWDFSITPASGQITDGYGSSLILQGGRGRGTGTPGKFIVQTSTATTTGTTLQTLSNRLEVDGTGQLKLNGYTSTSVFTGTVAGLLGFDSSGNVITTSASGGGITGSGTAGQVTYWSGTSAVTGNATLTYTPTTSLLVNNSVTASGAIARGVNFTPTLVAAANNDVLVGLDIVPTFTNGAFTGVSNYAARINGKLLITYTDNNYGIGIQVQNPSTGTSAITGVLLLNSSGSNVALFGYYPSNYVVSAQQNTVMFASITNQKLGFQACASSNGVAQDIWFSTFGTNSTYQMLIKGSSGNILINTNTDGGQRLQVIGSMRVGTTAASAMYWDDTNARLIIGNTSGTARLDVGASTTSASALRIRSGTAPTSPNDGDIWYDGTNIYIRVGTTTKTFTII